MSANISSGTEILRFSVSIIILRPRPFVVGYMSFLGLIIHPRSPNNLKSV